ncbi:winged helix-turn-helix domain-containing protein [Candidatus Saccharibacteria bacterium]|nr:winged helix-turn-helix domain-containing protein [Candidatus Saccharibacteria bacterium]MCL1963097.1 winged helix-turn-helix domain-containing protein [Candidatus Saccharibacteria bacterium]
MIDALFSSKTRVKLLNLFLNNPGRAFYVREITREVDEQINSVRRELANLVSVGVVRAETTDNKLYYEVDTAYQFYEPLKTIFTNTEAVASDTKVSIDTWAKKLNSIGDIGAVLFSGKLVHGSDSQVDVLIAGDNISQIKLKNTIKALEHDSSSSLAYTTMTFNDFYYRYSVRDQFVMDILSAKHVVVLDKSSVLSEEYDVNNTIKEKK